MQTTPSTGVFHVFMNLPRELRDQIWTDAITEAAEPALYIYRKGCWYPRPVVPSDNVPSNHAFVLAFQAERVGLKLFDMPLFFVNREAREAALAWIRFHDARIRSYADTNGQLLPPVFLRRMDPTRDSLYIPYERFLDFLEEPAEQGRDASQARRRVRGRGRRPGGVYLPYHQWAEIERIVLPFDLFQELGDSEMLIGEFIRLMDCFGTFEPVALIDLDDELEDGLQSMAIHRQMRWAWDLVSSGDGTLRIVPSLSSS